MLMASCLIMLRQLAPPPELLLALGLEVDAVDRSCSRCLVTIYIL